MLDFVDNGVCSTFAEKHKVAVSVNDFVVRAVAVALQRVPEANGELNEWVSCTLCHTNCWMKPQREEVLL
jgi:pyruvate/2-oxoglutarate dehydrogenase complex dihydrolipoamide acyltransferase (E2) component